MGTRIKDLTESTDAPTSDDFLVIDIDDGAGGFDTKKIKMTTFGQSSGVWVSETITSAEMLALNSTPKTIFTGLGAGIVAIVDQVIIAGVYNTTQYATNLDLAFKYASASVDLFESVGVLDFNTTITSSAERVYTPKSIEFVANSEFQAYVRTGNPRNGDSDLTIYVHYTILTS